MTKAWINALKSCEPLLANRYFQLTFWTVATGLILFIVSVFLWDFGPVNSMEYALLDLKMRYRANNFDDPSLTPSQDIVILAIDKITDQYIRLHPESGLATITPRAKMAEVVNYLHRQGAQAIVFDLEFRDNKPGDTQLAQAFSQSRPIFAADRMDLSFKPFEAAQQQPFITGQKVYSPDIFLEKGLFSPYLNYLSRSRARWMPWKTVGPLDIGAAPFYTPFPTLHPANRPDSVLNTRTQNLNSLYPVWQSSPLSYSVSPIPVFQSETYSDFNEQAYSQVCLKDYYQHYYQRNRQFLRFLNQQRLLVNFNSPLSDEVNGDITYCYIFPIAAKLAPQITHIGSTAIDYDEDAYMRSVKALYKGYNGNYYAYLGMQSAIDLLGVKQVSYTSDALYLDNRKIPLKDGRKIFINWKNPKLLIKTILAHYHIPAEEIARQLKHVEAGKNNPMLNNGQVYRHVSMIDVLTLAEGKPLVDDAQGRMKNIPFYAASGDFSFKNKIVVVGDTLTDVHRTPISNTTFGPEIVASALDMFLHDRVFVQQPPSWLQWSLVMLLSVALAIAIITFENLTIGFAIGIVLITLYWLCNLLTFVHWGYWLDLILPSFIMGFSLASATLYRYYIHDQEKHHLTNVFSKYVSPQIMGEIMKNPARALDNLKGGKKELTVLFADLQGFTQQFENADPELMVYQLNEYFDCMTEIVLAHGGTYDKYMGDSIMAFFGAPADLPEHARRACRAAVAMQNALQTLNENWAVQGHKILSHGIGISSGEMFVGNFGSKNIKNFTVMGSNVNLGARLEAYTRVAHWPIIISERTLAMIQDAAQVQDLGLIHVKGFSADVQIYGLESVDGVTVDLGWTQTHDQTANPS